MRRILLLATALILLAACAPTPAPEGGGVLPTRIDFDAVNATGTAAAAAAEGTAQALRPTLPPTWTPTDTPSPTLTPAPVTLDPTQAALTTAGTIYYVYNNDSIARVPADGARQSDLVWVGGAPSDLTLSPDGQYIAFVAQGSGSAREVWVINRDGTYRQQVSCLGFARVLSPAWSPDGAMLAFAASQTLAGWLNLYVANFAGAGACPSGNQQRPITGFVQPTLTPTQENDTPQPPRNLPGNSIRDLVWSVDGYGVFYSNTDLYFVPVVAADLAQTAAPIRVLESSGFGADFMLQVDVVSRLGYFIRSEPGFDGSAGKPFQMDVSAPGSPVRLQPLSGLLVSWLRYDPTTTTLLMVTDRQIVVLNPATGSSTTVFEGWTAPHPQPVFNPAADRVAFIAEARGVAQVFTVPRAGGDFRQITFNTEGKISELVWAPG